MADEGGVQEHPVTDEIVQKAVRAARGPDAQLVSWKIKDFTNKGDNYACLVTSVVVQYTLGDLQKETTFVAKMMRTQNSGGFSDMVRKSFKREDACLAEIVPRMNKILKELGLREIGIAKTYYTSCETGKELLLLEDLRTRGFKMFDRRRGMDIPHARLVLTELGMLHAASLLLERILPEHDITKAWQVFEDDWMNDGEAKKMFGAMSRNQLEGAALIMEKVPNYGHVVDWINKIKETSVDIFMNSFATSSDFGVLIHGDCWNNNLLFRYDAAGDPVEVMLVDLQIMRRASPAVDLNYFLYSSFNGPDRTPNLETYLKIYHTSFSSVLEAGGAAVPYTLEELREEFRRRMLFGCITGMFLIPIVLSEAEDVPDLDAMTDGNMEEFAKERQEVVLKMSMRDDGLLKHRFLDMFDDMLEAGIIS
ncbi:uncharacterized protein [Procambarus clarkii]|uniref:uncharacterized protein n=1 Tax=Procambarus clarkii TaxID=6728 RepID=UPI001E671EB3|nr:uncharacterized protein LOC123758412 [Procambarus clarkii]